MQESQIEKLTTDFAVQLDTFIDRRAKEMIVSLFSNAGSSPLKNSVVETRPVRKAPKQLCPVPGCKKAAAPVYNMVCADHRDTSPRRVGQFRKARKLAKKLGKPVGELLKNWEQYRRQAE